MPIDNALKALLPETIRPRDIDVWISWHRNIKQPIAGYFDIANVNEAPSLDGHKRLVETIQVLLNEARNRALQVRPFGGTWSFSHVAASPGWMVDTAYLNWVFPMGGDILAGAYAGKTDELFFVQSGTKISQLNRIIEKDYKRSLNTSGASNGQTIAGAIATGTHGSAIDQGSLQNHIVGMHMVTGPSRHVWIERASDPATEATRFAGMLGAELIRDDDIFNSALVSFGCMGFVAAVMLKTVPLFLLNASRDWIHYDENLKRVLTTLDFENISLPGKNAVTNHERPYFFQAVINPYDLDKASVTVMYKKPYHGENIDYTLNSDLDPGYELLGTIGALTDTFGQSIPLLVNQSTKIKLKPFHDRIGTIGETFDFTTPKSDALGAGIGIALPDVVRVMEILLDEQKNGEAAPIAFACRYVNHAEGTLEFTRHKPGCVIDMDGINSIRTRAFFDQIWQRLDKAGIHYTQHWGKVNNYAPSNIRKRFGDTAVDKWLAARTSLLENKECKVIFNNPFLEQVGLAG